MRSPTLRELPSPPSGRTGWPWTEASPALPQTMTDGLPWPKASIITPSYNQGAFIEETIRSVLLQGYPNLEYVIMDGGSTDESVEIIQKYEKWLTYWVSEPDGGQSHAINKGMARATGDILNWLNSDDYLLPCALEYLSQVYQSLGESACILAGDGVRVDGEGKLLQKSPVRQTARGSSPFALPVFGGVQASWFFTKEAWNLVGELDAALVYSMDVDLYQQCRQQGVRFLPVNETLAAFRVHGSAKTTKHVAATIRERYELLSKYAENGSLGERENLLYWLHRDISGHYLRAASRVPGVAGRLHLLVQGARCFPRRLLQRNFWSVAFRPATKSLSS